MGCGSSKSTDAYSNENNLGDKTEENKEDEREEIKEEGQEKKEAGDAEIKEKRDKFGQEALEAHNKYRAKHSTSELILNPELQEIAQKWADHLAAEKSFEHSKTEDRKCSKGSTGENLFYSGSTGELEINGADAVESWYNEIKDYDFEKPGFAMDTGHFTQVVWEGTKEVGFGFATYQDGEYNKLVVVGNYYPAGNIMKQFEDNVKPAKNEECDKNDDKSEEKKGDNIEEKKKPEKRAKGK